MVTRTAVPQYSHVQILTFVSQLSGEQVDHVFKIRKDAKGALTLDFDKELRHWPHSLQAFKEL